MPSKAQIYTQLADDTARQLTHSYKDWTAFLTTAARLYKYPYHEQLMIYAQRSATRRAKPPISSMWVSYHKPTLK